MREQIRRLYSEACHGAGAAERWAARDKLDAMAAQMGIRVSNLLEEAGFDLGAYFASRPISR